MATLLSDRKLKPPEAAAYIGRSVPTLARYRVMGGGPKYLKLGNKKQSQILYRLSDLDEWLDTQVRRSTSDCGEAI